jgi:uroporphyrinogen decarboxylase
MTYLRYRVALQGNLDPAVLLGTIEQVVQASKYVPDDFGVPASGHGHIFNLGHGISQHTPSENVLAMVETAHDDSARQRRSNGF